MRTGNCDPTVNIFIAKVTVQSLPEHFLESYFLSDPLRNSLGFPSNARLLYNLIIFQSALYTSWSSIFLFFFIIISTPSQHHIHSPPFIRWTISFNICIHYCFLAVYNSALPPPFVHDARKISVRSSETGN